MCPVGEFAQLIRVSCPNYKVRFILNRKNIKATIIIISPITITVIFAGFDTSIEIKEQAGRGTNASGLDIILAHIIGADEQQSTF